MLSKSAVGSVMLCTILITTSRLSGTRAQMYKQIKEGKFHAFVSCEHAEKLFSLDRSMFDLGSVLDKCWHQGRTIKEIEGGLEPRAHRPDIQNYQFRDLHLPCDDVFKANITRLSSGLLRDFINCRNARALESPNRRAIERRFGDIIYVYENGNSSVRIDEETLVSCANFTKRITSFCHEYGLTEDQWSKGFLRYNYPDKWAVEESIDEMSLTCAHVFKANLHLRLYDNYTEMFIKCQNSMPIEPEIRDYFEKKYAEELQKVGDEETRNDSRVDLRSYVSCRHLQPVSLGGIEVSASKHALDACRRSGLTYEEIRNGSRRRMPDATELRNFTNLYVDCNDVFGRYLNSFTSALINDYEFCRAAGKVSLPNRRAVWMRFDKLFKLLARKRMSNVSNPLERLVSCAGFEDELADLCRRRGVSLAQELRDVGSLAQVFPDKWLNAEKLGRLYVSCDDLLEESRKQWIERLPIDRFIHCRWLGGIPESKEVLVDKMIGQLYRKTQEQNVTRYRGDADVEISSLILFD